jgi:hypothetical protein
LKGDLLQHERFGIGRVETTAPGGAPACEVFFPRLDIHSVVVVICRIFFTVLSNPNISKGSELPSETCGEGHARRAG